MLARHLLFIATRLHHNTILAIDSVPPHGIVQPPPYVSPPKPDECQKEKIQQILKNAPPLQKIQTRCEKQPGYGRRPADTPVFYSQDPRRNPYENNRLLERKQTAGCNEFQRGCEQRQIVHMRNARNQQYCVAGKDVNQQFYTLPSRRPQRDAEPPRSVTPDITRGLGRGSFATMHVLTRHGQKAVIEQDSNRYGSQMELNRRNSDGYETDNRLNQNQPIVDIRNRFATPLGLTALGYRFFASSPVRDPVTKSSSADALKYNPISPIGHGHGNSFKSSTPTDRSAPTVAERLAAAGGNHGSTSMPNSGRSTPVQSSSGRSTPTNLILSPTKSTMSNEELFAAIHKSKKRLNIKDDNESLSPYGSTSSLAKMSPGSRNSWSSDSQKVPMVTQNAQPASPSTSRLDFKRLLLQQSVKTGPTRLSAAEQLKLSRQQCQQQQSSPSVQPTASLAKVLSPRSIWRFQTPRTDVLSSTIIEDTVAEEKAMKPSPENASPVSRVSARRQLDLCSDIPENLRTTESKSVDRLSFDDAEVSSTDLTVGRKSPGRDGQVEPASAENCVSAGNNNCLSSVPDTSVSVSDAQSDAVCSQLTPSCQQAISAFESRRISNQLARAQFLSSTPSVASQDRSSYAKKIFRARSVSPQEPGVQSVTRSPSVPTLETAL